MVKRRRLSILAALLKGLAAAVIFTVVCMLIMAAAVVFLGMSDTLIRVMNQIIKIMAAAIGTYISVRRGGERGFVTGAGIGAIYAAAGYILYILLGGGEFDIVELMGEMTICVAAGALTGAVCANLKPMRKSS